MDAKMKNPTKQNVFLVQVLDYRERDIAASPVNPTSFQITGNLIIGK